MGDSVPAPDHNLGLRLSSCADRLGDAPAIEDGATTTSHGELHAWAKALAGALIRGGVRYEDPVGILTGSATNHIVGQIAVVYAGGTCVPLNHDLSDGDLEVRLDAVKARHVVVDKSQADRPLRVSTLVDVGDGGRAPPELDEGGDAEDGNAEDRGADIPRAVRPEFRSHIFFTSGTTGKPKAVQVPGRGILRLVDDPVLYKDSRGLRFGHINDYSFDLSLLDTFLALLHDGVIVVMARQEALSPEALASSLEERRVEHLMLPAAWFNAVGPAHPTAFSGLSTLATGGEAPSIDACRAVLSSRPPNRLVNAYGPAECSILASAHQVTLAELKGGVDVPIGKPLQGTSIYILDGDLRPVRCQAEGELCLGGVGLSAGYLDDEEKTREAFVAVPDLEARGETTTVYRTGDLAYANRQGDLVWIGRKDREVKVRGRRVQLDLVEAELLTLETVREVAVMKVAPPGTGPAILVACVSCDDADEGSLTSLARSRLPSYSVPRFILFDKLPVSARGKLDRKKLTRDVMERLQSRHHETDEPGPERQGSLTETEGKLRSLWGQMLATVPEERMGPESDFFDLGASSLDAVSLLGSVRDEFGAAISTRALYEHADLRGLARCIDEGNPQTFAEQVRETRDAMLSDATELSSDIPIPAGSPVDWQSPEEGNVFLTGATGFVGAFQLVELARLPAVKKIRCLVRAGSRDAAFDRLFENLARYRLDALDHSLRSKIDVVPGDLSKPKLGLADEDFHELALWSSVIYHLGATVNYTKPYTAHRGVNVLGTLQVLELAAAGRPKAFHFTSTISIFGLTGLIKEPSDEIGEDEPLEQYLMRTQPYESGYSQSKWVADKMVSDLMHRGFPASVYRLGFVLCDGTTGVGNPEDFVARLLSDCVRLGIYPQLPGQRMELLTVGSAVSAILAGSLSGDGLRRVYHVLPDPRSSIDMETLFRQVEHLRHADMTGLPYPDWAERLEQADREGVSLRLKPLLPALMERVIGDRTRWEANEGMATFKIDNTVAAVEALDERGLAKPTAFDEGALGRYLGFLGLLEAAT